MKHDKYRVYLIDLEHTIWDSMYRNRKQGPITGEEGPIVGVGSPCDGEGDPVGDERGLVGGERGPADG